MHANGFLSRLNQRIFVHRAVMIQPLVLVLFALPSFCAADCVVLLHGLARTSSAMKHMAKPFDAAGHQVVNVNYPSRKDSIENLAPLAVKTMGFDQCDSSDTVHFVTHSMGGILLRYYLAHNELSASGTKLGRVVMLAPPNQGSQVVDKLKNAVGYQLFNGPAGMQLGTDVNSIPMQLKKFGAVDYDVGIIAGSKTFNPILSQFLPNPDDGKVSVENTKLAGMKDFIALPVTHTFMMKSKSVIEQAVHYIKTGSFNRG